MAALLLSVNVYSQSLPDTIDNAFLLYTKGDFANAIQMLETLSNQGNARAKSLLGVIYYNGSGVEPDDTLAYTFFREAAELGDADAQFNLADMYMYVDELPVEFEDRYEEAARWYFSAANNGHSEAQYTLGLLLLAGTGVIQDPDQAIIWIRRAADAGLVEAQQYVSDYDNQ